MKALQNALVATISLCATSSLRHASATTTSSPLTSAATNTVQGALTAPYAANITAAAAGMTCSGNTAILSDGNTSDTDGLLSAVAQAKASPGGAEISLPPGQCEINSEIDIPVNVSLRFAGAGIGLTKLEFFTPSGVKTPVGNGLVFSVANGASLTVDDFSISRRLGSNLGTTFVGTAINISAASASPNTGPVTTTNLNILPAAANAQTDSWNTGLLETNINGPTISNVTINLPGWGYLPDPTGYTCVASGGAQIPCAIHSLPSPANPTTTPSLLGFGTATGVALQGSGTGNLLTGSVIMALTVSGGLVGLDLRQFQGAYVTNSKFASDVYGVRADTSGTGSGNLSIGNSLFTETVAGVYMNGLAGAELDGNYITPGDTATTNLPAWAGVWARNANQVTISSNNVVGGGSAVRPLYGIFLSSDALNAAPASVDGNTVFNLSSIGSVCIGNDANTETVNVSGNSMIGCTTNVSDPTNANSYADNTMQYPDEYDDGNRDVQFPRTVTIGSSSTTGSLQLVTDGVQKFLVDSSGDVTAAGSVATGGSIAATGTVEGSSVVSASTFVLSGNSSHSSAEEVAGNFIIGAGTIVLNPPSGAFPAFTAGIVTLYGELSCSSPGAIISWHVEGHYAISNNVLQPEGFSATVENDGDSQWLNGLLAGTNTIVPQLNPTSIGLQVVFGSGNTSVYDCTATLQQMINN